MAVWRSVGRLSHQDDSVPKKETSLKCLVITGVEFSLFILLRPRLDKDSLSLVGTQHARENYEIKSRKQSVFPFIFYVISYGSFSVCVCVCVMS